MTRWATLVVVLLLAAQAAAQERIVDYQSNIVVHEDGTLDVEETIAVVAEAQQINHGIYRDFPTTYDGPWFTRRVVPFDHVHVRRDGNDEPFRLEEVDNGMRVYAGSKDVSLPTGPHTYVIDYRTAEQLGFFDDHDELYWNVTGNGWLFTIDRVSATVVLPKPVPRKGVKVEAYTGYSGDKGQDVASTVDPSTGLIHFTTTRQLAAGEGLTIVVSFPKGFVRQPTDDERRSAFLRDNRPLLVAFAGAGVVVLYFLGVWFLVGRDPARGTIIPRFAPPRDMSPACLRYLRNMEYDEGCFSAGLLGLAAKGAVRIVEKSGEYTIQKSKSETAKALSLDERRLMTSLLKSGSIVLEQKNHATIRGAARDLQEALKLEYEGTMFVANYRWFLPGVVLTFLVVLASAMSGTNEQKVQAAFITFWLSGWTFGVYSLGKSMLQAWAALFLPKGVFARIGAFIVAVFTTAFALPFMAGEAFGLYILGRATTLWMIPILLGLVGLAVLFYELLKRPTIAGRALMDEIDGFEMYLVTAEADVIRKMAGPPRTLELYERLLPYAVALDVESTWTEQFADQIAKASADDPKAGYHPGWYTGSTLGTASLMSGIGSSMSSAISSSSTAPGSSSGSSGGGSSGGGGGGGGGGGW
ncbi:MAG TPA: DUF2207 domain-containing protein [Candidatus Binatia bacterium]|nr:DUF2207 domain-containing protein [Candidatus Binatia bacterium]